MSIIDAGSFLTLHYRLSGPDGADIINTFAEKPATLSMGSGDLSNALETRLLGLTEGEHRSFEVPPGEAFGQRNPDMLQWVASSLLKTLGDLHETYNEGDVVQFPTPSGVGGYAGIVRKVEAERVLFDFNHPLAGQGVRFEVKVIGIL